MPMAVGGRGRVEGKLIGGEEVKELRGERVGSVIRNYDRQY